MALLAVNTSLGSDANTYAQVAAGTHQWAHIERSFYGSTNREARNAAEAAQAGDEVQVAAATYSIQMAGDRFAAGLYPENTGTALNPITWKAMGEVTLQSDISASGTATSATASTLTDTAAGWTLGQWGSGSDYAVKITGGTGVGQIRWITNNNVSADTLDLQENWAVTPDATSTYQIIETGPILGGQTGRDYLQFTVDDLATCKWVINGEDSPVHPDTGHVVLVGCIGVLVEGFEINAVQSFYSDNINCIRLENADTCTVRNNWLSGARHTISSSHNGAAIMTYSAYNCVLEHNDMSDCGDGINIKGESYLPQTANIVRYNLIHGCRVGIRIDFSLGVGQSECYQNIIRDNSDAGNGLGINIGNDVRNWDIYNNTIENFTGSAIYYNSGSSRTNLSFRDNLISNCTTGMNLGDITSVGTDSLNYDHVYIGTGARFGAFNGSNHATRALFNAATGLEANGGDDDPLYTNAAIDDYTLQTGSPARTSSSISGPVGAYILGTEVIGVNTAGAGGGGGSGGGSPPPAVGWTQEVALVSGTGWLSEGLL